MEQVSRCPHRRAVGGGMRVCEHHTRFDELRRECSTGRPAKRGSTTTSSTGAPLLLQFFPHQVGQMFLAEAGQRPAIDKILGRRDDFQDLGILQVLLHALAHLG